MHGLTDRGDLGHQDGGGLQIPIGVRDVSVAEIGGESDEMACDGIGVVATLFKRANREGVAQVVDARSSLARLSSQPYGSRQAQEDTLHGVVAEHIACGGHEQGVSRRPKLHPHDRYWFSARDVVWCKGNRRLFWNLVCLMTRPSAVMSSRHIAKASDIRMPVAASRPNNVVYVSGRIEPAGGQGCGGTEQPDDLIRRIDMGCPAPERRAPQRVGLRVPRGGYPQRIAQERSALS